MDNNPSTPPAVLDQSAEDILTPTASDETLEAAGDMTKAARITDWSCISSVYGYNCCLSVDS